MKRLLVMAWAVICPIGVLIGLAGCQCSGVAERSADLVDCISDHPPEWDALYHPCWDLTRIGQPDWCGCGFNRWWCKRACCAAHCGEPCPMCPCPFCLEEKSIAEIAPAVGPPRRAGTESRPLQVTPKLPPAPNPPDDPPPPRKDARRRTHPGPPPAPGATIPASQDSALPTQ